jgi:hypothetical protein
MENYFIANSLEHFLAGQIWQFSRACRGNAAVSRGTLAIEIRTTAPIWAWHKRLAAALRSDGHRLRLVRAAGPSRSPPGVELLVALQRFVYRAPPSVFAAAELADEADFDTMADLVLPLAGSAWPDDVLCLVPQFDGTPDEDALIAALFAGRAPALSLSLALPGETTQIVARGLPAIEDPVMLVRSLDQVTARLVSLIRRTVRHIAAGTVVADDTIPSPPSILPERSALGFFLCGFASRIRGRLHRMSSHPDHWFIGWRNASDAGVAHDLAWPQANYQMLADDGQRYFADPFPFAHEGRNYIFCEEFPYATRKGVISVFERAADGSFTVPKVVLERPYHLSYPQIIVRDGAIFMLPETCAAGRIELYRAERFPDVWVRHATLVDDVMASDATWIEYGGRHWIFAALAGDGGSTWDQLGLYHAPDLFGPWLPHPDNPVLIDAGAARPGGEMWVRDGRLWRVAQDCRLRYGGGLALCRVDALTPERFTQTVVTRLGPPGQGATGVHTLNKTPDVETIDWCQPHSRRTRTT